MCASGKRLETIVLPKTIQNIPERLQGANYNFYSRSSCSQNITQEKWSIGIGGC